MIRLPRVFGLFISAHIQDCYVLQDFTLVAVLSPHMPLMYPHLWCHLRYQTVCFLFTTLAFLGTKINNQCFSGQLLCCLLFHFQPVAALHNLPNLLSSPTLYATLSPFYLNCDLKLRVASIGSLLFWFIESFCFRELFKVCKETFVFVKKRLESH